MRFSRILAIGLSLFVVATACTPGSTAGPSPSGAGTQSAAPTASAAATKEFDNVTVKWAGATLDYGALLEVAAKEQLAPRGINMEIQFGLSPENVTQLMVQGQAVGGWAAVIAFLPAIRGGAPIRVALSGVRNTFSYVSAPTIKSYQELAGKKVAVHSPVSFTRVVTDALIKKYSIQNVTTLIIQGSDVRLQALLNKQIDATTVDLADIINLRSTAGESAVTQLGTVSQEFPGLMYTTVGMRADFIQQQPKVAQAIADAFVAGAKKMNSDPAYAKSLAAKMLPDAKPEIRDGIVDAFIKAGVWNATDLNQQSAQTTLKFLHDFGAIDFAPESVKLEDIFNFSLVKQ